MYRFINLGRSYFGKLDEESVKNNFVSVAAPPRAQLPAPYSGLTKFLPCNRLIYELLDGKATFILDYSPATRSLNSSGDTPPSLAQRSSISVTRKIQRATRSRCISRPRGSSLSRQWCVPLRVRKTAGIRILYRGTDRSGFIVGTIHAQREEASKITIQATGAISWRRSDVKYRKNEAFVDVIETVNLSMNSKGVLSYIPSIWQSRFPSRALIRSGSRYACPGTVLRADVDGQILMRAYLSGTPECKFGLNDKLVLDKTYVLRPAFPYLNDRALRVRCKGRAVRD